MRFESHSDTHLDSLRGSTHSLNRAVRKHNFRPTELQAVGLETASLFAEAFNINQSSPGSAYESSHLYSPKRKRSRVSINLVRRLSSLFSSGRSGSNSPPGYDYIGQYKYSRYNSQSGYASTLPIVTPSPFRTSSLVGSSSEGSVRSERPSSRSISRRQILASLQEGLNDDAGEEIAPVHRFSRATLLRSITLEEEPETQLSKIRFRVGPDSRTESDQGSDSDFDLPMVSRKSEEPNPNSFCSQALNERHYNDVGSSETLSDASMYAIVDKKKTKKVASEKKEVVTPPSEHVEQHAVKVKHTAASKDNKLYEKSLVNDKAVIEVTVGNINLPKLDTPLTETTKRHTEIIPLPNAAPEVNAQSLKLEAVSHLTSNKETAELLSFYDDKESNYRRSDSSPQLQDDQQVGGYHRSVSAPELGVTHLKLSDLNWVATLGVGGFGRVELVTAGDNNNESFALKKMKKSEIGDEKKQQHILNEKNIMENCENSFIVRLYKTFKDRKYLYMLMEPCLGGELWTILRNHTRFDDSTARFYTACVIEAFEYLHSKSIIYRDLKPENLLLDSSGYVKLVDFGFSKQLGSDGKAWTFCGTPEYVAPEIITNKSHDHRADIWSLGILMYELLTGRPPFVVRPDQGQVYPLILKGMKSVMFPRFLNSAACELIRQLCRLNPGQRPSLRMTRNYMWFAQFDWTALRDRSMEVPILPNVRNQADASNFDIYSKECGEVMEDLSDWDKDF